MRIITFQELLEQPRNSVFASYTPCVIGETMVKGHHVGSGDDFYERELMTNSDSIVLLVAQDNKEEFKLDNTWIRNGYTYDDDCLFVLYNKDDLIDIIKDIQSLVGSYT